MNTFVEHLQILVLSLFLIRKEMIFTIVNPQHGQIGFFVLVKRRKKNWFSFSSFLAFKKLHSNV